MSGKVIVEIAGTREHEPSGEIQIFLDFIFAFKKFWILLMDLQKKISLETILSIWVLKSSQ